MQNYKENRDFSVKTKIAAYAVPSLFLISERIAGFKTVIFLSPLFVMLLISLYLIHYI